MLVDYFVDYRHNKNLDRVAGPSRQHLKGALTRELSQIWANAIDHFT